MNSFESAIYSISTLAKLRHKACDTEQLRHQWKTSKPTLTETDFIGALNSLNLKVGIRTCKISDLNNEFMPVAAPISNGQFLTLLRVNQKGHDWFCFVIKPGETTPRKLNLAEFDQFWDNSIIFIKEREPSGSDRRFDLKWFIPSLIQHKGIFTEVIIISVFLQLFALATPFLFQIVMDKVLVHRGFTTLDILAIGDDGFDNIMDSRGSDTLVLEGINWERLQLEMLKDSLLIKDRDSNTEVTIQSANKNGIERIETDDGWADMADINALIHAIPQFDALDEEEVTLEDRNSLNNTLATAWHSE